MKQNKKVYASIGKYKNKDGYRAIYFADTNKTSFLKNCRLNGFIPYIAMDENKMVELVTFVQMNNERELVDTVKEMSSSKKHYFALVSYIMQAGEKLLDAMENYSK